MLLAFPELQNIVTPSVHAPWRFSLHPAMTLGQSDLLSHKVPDKKYSAWALKLAYYKLQFFKATSVHAFYDSKPIRHKTR